MRRSGTIICCSNNKIQKSVECSGHYLMQYTSYDPTGILMLGFKSQPVEKFNWKYLVHLCLIANSAIMSRLAKLCLWEAQMTGSLSCAKAKKNDVCNTS